MAAGQPVQTYCSRLGTRKWGPEQGAGTEAGEEVGFWSKSLYVLPGSFWLVGETLLIHPDPATLSLLRYAWGCIFNPPKTLGAHLIVK